MNPLHHAVVESLEQRLLMSTVFWHPTGGSTVWDNSTLNWNTGSGGSGTQVAFAAGDDAIFSETGTTVTIAASTAIHANSIWFVSDSYTVAGGSGATLTVATDISFSHDAAISAVVAGTSGLQVLGVAGAGTLTFSGANTYTGTTDISEGGTVQFTGAALAALPGVDLTVGGSGWGTLDIGGTVTWSGSDVDVSDSGQIDISGDVTIAGGDWTVEATGELINDGTLTISGGTLTAYYFENFGTLAVTGGSLDLADYAINHSGGTITWTGGSLSISSSEYDPFVNQGSFTIDGGSHSLSLSGEAAFDNDGGTIDWQSANVDVAVPIINEDGGSIALDGGSGTFTLDGVDLDNGNGSSATTTWSSGKVVLNGGAINNDDGDGATFTLDSEAEVTLDATGGSISGTITNEGTLHWTGTDMTYLDNLTNTGTIVFDDNPTLVTLTGSSSATEGSSYSLTIGSVSSYITNIDTITDYIVEWGDGIGYDDFTSSGAKAYTYGGGAANSNSYTINVHLIGDNGTYAFASHKDITVANGVQAPTGLTVTAEGLGGYHLSWTDNSSGETGEQVEAELPGTSQFVTVATLSAATTSYDLTGIDVAGLAPGAIWSTDNITFRVRSVGPGESGYSSSVTGTADTSVFGSGDTTTLSLSGGTLSWSQSTAESLTLVMVRTIGQASWQEFNSSGGSITSIGSIPEDWIYGASGIQVAIITEDGSSNVLGVSNIITINPTRTLTTPDLTSATVGSGGVTFTWSDSNPGASYEFYNLDSGYTAPAVDPEVGFSGSGTTSLFVSGLGPGRYVMLAVNGSATSAPSNAVNISLPNAPTDIEATALSGGAIGITWTNTAFNETGSTLERSDDGGTTWTALDPATDVTTFVDATAPPGVPVLYRVEYGGTNDTGDVQSGWDTMADTAVLSSSGDAEEVFVNPNPIAITRGGAAKTVVIHIWDGNDSRQPGGIVGGTVCDSKGGATTVPGLTLTLIPGTATDGYARFSISATTAVPGTGSTTYYVKFYDSEAHENFTVVKVTVSGP